MVVTAGAERCTGLLTCATTACSVPLALNYTVYSYIKYEGPHFHFKLFMLLDCFYGLFKKYQ